MRNILLLSVMALLLLPAGCKKVKSIANISINLPYSSEVDMPDIPGLASGTALPPPGLSVDFPPEGMATNIQSYFDTYHTDADNVVYVNINSLTMEILQPASQNFDFLDSAELYVSAKNQPAVLVAYDYQVPKGATSLNFTVLSGINLKTYFVTDTMYFTVHAHLNATPQTGTQLNIEGKFHLTANPLD